MPDRRANMLFDTDIFYLFIHRKFMNCGTCFSQSASQW
jgi:hypothetical protein